jgi:hypothetical protein
VSTATDLLDLAPHVGQRASDVRYDVLDAALTKIGTVTPTYEATPRVTVNSDSAVKRTISSIRLTPSDQASVDPFAHRLQPVWVLETGDEYPLGVFLFGSMDRLRREYGLEAEVAAVDQTIIVDQPIERTISLAPGDDVGTALRVLFSTANVPAFEVDGTITTTVASPIAWPVGTSRLKVMNELAAMAGAYSVYFDNAGVGIVRRVPSLADTVPTLVYDDGGRIIVDSMVESDDLLEAPNRYLVIDSSAAESPVYAHFDVPPEAPHSIARRGFAVTKVIDEQGLASPDAALARAEAAYEQDAGGFQWVQFSSPPDPRHDTFDAVGYRGVTYREQGWSLTLIEGAEMTHDLRRTYS